MSQKYPHLLEPFKIGNHVFKNHMICSASEPLFIQGNEPYPSEQLILHYANIAKNGAALITCCGAKDPHFRRAPKQRFGPVFDLDSTWSNYISHLVDSIHFYNSKATMRLCIDDADGYDVSAGIPSFAVAGDGSQSTVGKETPLDMLEAYIDDLVEQALIFKEHGFDGVYLHMAYKITVLGRFLSPLTNIRTDKYGGSFENRITYPLEVCARIKEACGKDFLIEVSISGYDAEPGGWTLDDSINFAKAAEGLIDLMDIRCANIDEQSVTNFHEPNPYLYLAEAIKKANPKVAIVTLGGYGNLDVMEDIIATGKADFIAMARTWISNPEYGNLAYSGRNEDIIPCIRCNKCHKSGVNVPWTPVCSVNPLHGMEHRYKNFIDAPTTKKKVAILGGGPAGLEAALVCKSRGHDVTLYEKSGELGGQLTFAKYVSFKWPLRDFLNYLINQVGRAGINVKLNTEATPEMLAGENYDTILAAMGSVPIIPSSIPGANLDHVIAAFDAYGNEDSLAENIVVVGGGEVGVETGMHLAEKGHTVTVIEMLSQLAADAAPVHYRSVMEHAWEALDKFSYVVNARVTGITPEGVTYLDQHGAEHRINAGTVILSIGSKALSDKALEFVRCGAQLFLVGDCNKPGNVQKLMRNAFGIASQI